MWTASILPNRHRKMLPSVLLCWKKCGEETGGREELACEREGEAGVVCLVLTSLCPNWMLLWESSRLHVSCRDASC